jgi:hypothetical protein
MADEVSAALAKRITGVLREAREKAIDRARDAQRSVVAIEDWKYSLTECLLTLAHDLQDHPIATIFDVPRAVGFNEMTLPEDAAAHLEQAMADPSRAARLRIPARRVG